MFTFLIHCETDEQSVETLKVKVVRRDRRCRTAREVSTVSTPDEAQRDAKSVAQCELSERENRHG